MEMPQINTPNEYKASNKRNVLCAILALAVGSTLVDWMAAGSMIVYQVTSIFTAIGYVVGTLIWCHIDARDRNVPLGQGFRILVILLGPIALIYYLFKSRGFTRGIISVAWMVGFILTIFVIATIENIILALISDRLGLFQ